VYIVVIDDASLKIAMFFPCLRPAALCESVVAIGLLVIAFFSFSDDVCAQTWEYTNGPYPQCGRNVIVDARGIVFIETCVGTLIGDTTLTGWHWDRSYGENSDELLARNDGTLAGYRNRSAIADTSWPFAYIRSDNLIYSASRVSDKIILASVEGIGVYRSLDTGKTWNWANDGLASTATRLIRTDAAGFIYLTTANGEVYSSTDSGSHWLQQLTLNRAIDVLSVAPNGDVFVAGDSEVWLSIDHGANYTKLSMPPNFGGLRAIAFRNKWIAIATQDRGVMISNDLLQWSTVNTGIDTTDVNGIAWVGSRGLLATTSQGGLFYRATTDSLWRHIPIGIAPSDIIRLTKPNEQRLFAATERHGIFRTDDRGDSWQMCYYAPLDSVTDMATFGPSVVIAMRHGLAHSGDGGVTFDTLIQWPGHSYVRKVIHDKSGNFYAIASDGIYYRNPTIFRSTNGGSVWSSVSAPPGLSPSGIEVDSANQLLFMAYVGPAAYPALKKSTDQGDTWLPTEIPFFLKDWNTNACSCAPDGAFYCAGQYGYYRSEDTSYTRWDELDDTRWRNIGIPSAYRTGTTFYSTEGYDIASTSDRGNTWQTGHAPWQPTSGMYYPIRSLAVAFNGELYAAADGVVRILELNSAVGSPIHPVSSFSGYVQNALTGMILQLNLPHATEAWIDIFDLLGRTVATLDERMLPEGHSSIPLPSGGTNKILFVRIHTTENSWTLPYAP
jgi:photosystem II stability/assembly factor-like uncharacterized protein